jgi:phage antirepressor YoqD-like protein
MKQGTRWRSLTEYVQHLAVNQEWMSLREAARLYRVTPETMQTWVRQNYFTSTRFNTALWISRAELEDGLRRLPTKSMPNLHC